MNFRNAMIELGLLGFLILVLALSIYFLNRSPRRENFYRKARAIRQLMPFSNGQPL